jgi:hypothetical protein
MGSARATVDRVRNACAQTAALNLGVQVVSLPFGASMRVGCLATGLYGAPTDGLQGKLWGKGRKISSEGLGVDKSQAKRFSY